MNQPLKTIIFILGLGIIAYAVYLAYSPRIEPQDGNIPGEIDKGISYEVTISGSFACLPHQNPGEVQTLECAYGLQTADGGYYALDLGLLSLDERNKVEAGGLVTVSGTLVYKEALSSDMWQKYAMVGIIQVKSVQ